MAAWSTDKREYTEHRWILAAPAHHTDIMSALDAAQRAWSRHESGCSDITIKGEDATVVVFFTVRNPPRPTRQRLGDETAVAQDD